jgi:hypothetical protein
MMYYVWLTVAVVCFTYVADQARRPISKRAQRRRSRLRFMRIYQARSQYLQLKTAELGNLQSAITGRLTLLADWTGEQPTVPLRKLRWDDFMHETVRA